MKEKTQKKIISDFISEADFYYLKYSILKQKELSEKIAKMENDFIEKAQVDAAKNELEGIRQKAYDISETAEKQYLAYVTLSFYTP
jgi:hypothetical protein